MNRRTFITTTSAALLSTLLANSIGASVHSLPAEFMNWRPARPKNGKQGPAPLPEITAVVDVLVPPDPEIPGDFKGTDYGADWIVASVLDDLGQRAVVLFLNRYARKVAKKKFIVCTPEQQLEAVKRWVRERDNMNPLIKDMLSGLLTMSVIGTFEDNDEQESQEVFTAMGWFDPEDPGGTFRLPNNGYPDSFQFPAKLKKGLKK